MPHFVPVYDPERPRAEQDAADPALRAHRRWETPHALLSAEAGEEKDDRPTKLRPVRSHMIRNEKGLWVPIARVKAEAARREQQQERAHQKWGGGPWLEREKEEREQQQSAEQARARDEDSCYVGVRQARGQDGKSKQSSASGAIAAPVGAEGDGRGYVRECRERSRSRSSPMHRRSVGGSGSDSLRERRPQKISTPLYYERRTNRQRYAAEDADAQTEGTSSYYRKEFRDDSRGAGTRRGVSGSKSTSDSERVARDRRSRSNSPSSARCSATQSRGAVDDRRTLHEERRHPSRGSEVTLTNVTAPSGKIDMFDYMTKKQKALLKQRLSQPALPSRR